MQRPRKPSYPDNVIQPSKSQPQSETQDFASPPVENSELKENLWLFGGIGVLLGALGLYKYIKNPKNKLKTDNTEPLDSTSQTNARQSRATNNDTTNNTKRRNRRKNSKLTVEEEMHQQSKALRGKFIKDTLNIFKAFFTKKIDPNASESQKLSSSIELTNQILLTFSQIDEVQNEQKFAEISHMMATIQNVFSNLPKNCEHYSDLPQEKRYLLYSLMVDALTSEFKDIAKLGDNLAKAFGLKPSLVNKIKKEVSVIKSKSKRE